MSQPERGTIAETVALVRRGELTASALVEQALAHIAALEPQIKAWALVDADGARQAAVATDHLARRGAVLPLHGIPVGVKDIIDVAGLPTQAGFAPRAHHVAQHDAAIVARLRALGAILLGKTHTTQFAFADPAPTRNPWHLEHTPGGSSSGSAAAVAARMVPLAIGTQTAGSVLRPAAYCGVVGFKPTYNWFPLAGTLPLAWSLDHLGLFARSVRDITLAYAAICEQRVDATGREVAPSLVVLTDFLDRTEPTARQHFRETVDRLHGAGAQVREQRLPIDLDLILDVHHVIMLTEMAAAHWQQLHAYPDAYGPRLRAAVEAGQLVPASLALHARRLRGEITRQLNDLAQTADALVLPTVSGPAPGLETTGDRSFQAVWSLTGMPSISLPSGLSPDGLPLGLQLVGQRACDRRLLHVAAWCEQVLPVLPTPPIVAASSVARD